MLSAARYMHAQCSNAFENKGLIAVRGLHHLYTMLNATYTLRQIENTDTGDCKTMDAGDSEMTETSELN